MGIVDYDLENGMKDISIFCVSVGREICCLDTFSDSLKQISGLQEAGNVFS